MRENKECIRCGNTQKEIIRDGIKECYVGWGTYKRHSYSESLITDNYKYRKNKGREMMVSNSCRS